MEEGRSSPRYNVEVQGRYRMGTGVARDVPILDLSETGCRMFDRFGRLPKGSKMSLRIGEIGPIEAEVMWCEKNVVGVEFERPLYGPVFEHLRERVAAANRPSGG